jgi:hypothetical protein
MTQERLEEIGATFLKGYHVALACNTSAETIGQLESTPQELRGFAIEGAAMGLALRDALSPGRANRVSGLLNGAGDAHSYMIHVGVGWVWARVPFARRRIVPHLDPLLHWLAFDGWGFHEGFFHWRKYLAGHSWPGQLNAPERRVFDQGLGRSLWFVRGGNPELIATAIGGLSVSRRADLWSGVGLAATYAGIVEEATLRRLRELAGEHRSQLAQGSAFAAKARQRAGNLTDYTGLATEALCEMSASDAAHLCDIALENLPASAEQTAYETWRQRIQRHFQKLRQLQETK